MQKISLRDFKNICDSLSPTKFIISSDNQSWLKSCFGIGFNLNFSNMSVVFNPNVICFKNTYGNITLGVVNDILLHDEDSLLGKIFTINCGGNSPKTQGLSYTIVVQ